jgi:hypothetical protein
MINIIPEKKIAHSKIRIKLRNKLRRINDESEDVLQVGFMDPYFNIQDLYRRTSSSNCI